MPSSTTKILIGVAAAIAVATVAYLPDSQAEPSEGVATKAAATSSKPAPTVDHAPAHESAAPTSPEVAKKVAKTKPPVDWKAAKAGIERALEARKDTSDREPADKAWRHDPQEAPMGSLSKEYIRDTVKEDVVPLVRECYNNLLEKDPEIAGRMVMQFAIMGDESVGGIVDEMEFAEESEIQDEDFRECVSESMMSTVFEAPDEGGKVIVKYPFVFTTDDSPGAEPHKPG